MSRLKSKITYANVVASLALFVALGGLSYAAITLPKNSVGSKQIKANAVTSAKVKQGTLQQGDFAPGVLQAGGAGPPGPKGDQGIQGVRGIQGLQGPKGGSTDLGFLDPANDLPGANVARIEVDGSQVGSTFKGYRVTCPAGEGCTVTIGGVQDDDFEDWFEIRNTVQGTRDFMLIESAGGPPLRAYYVTNGRPIAYKTQGGRFEMTFSTEQILFNPS
jgi:hypothetical protein